MKLYEYRDIINDCGRLLALKSERKKLGSQNFEEIKNWKQVYDALSRLNEFIFFKTDFISIINYGTQLNNDHNTPSIEAGKYSLLNRDIEKIKAKCEGIVDFIDIFYNKEPKIENYVYIMLPETIRFDELKSVSEKINYILNNCPGLEECKDAKIIGVEKGSSNLIMLLKDGAEILKALLPFVEFISICVGAYLVIGQANLALQKIRTEKLNREILEERIKEKKDDPKKLNDFTINAINDVLQEDYDKMLEDKIIMKYKESDEFKEIELDISKKNALITSAKYVFELTEKGVVFNVSEKADEKVKKILPIKDEVIKIEETKKLEEGNDE